MERNFLNNNFHYVHVVSVSNGTGWTTDALADQIVTLYRALDFRGDAVVVWVDRERRSESASHIHGVITTALITAGASRTSTHVLVSDRMIENIILSDEALMKTTIINPNYTYSMEGSGGKHVLKSLLKTAGIEYKETTVGASLLKKVRLHRCAVSSPAVARFMVNMNMPCWWLTSPT